MLGCLTILAFVFAYPSEAPSELRTAVSGYWANLAGGDKAAALAWLAPESRNTFMSRKEPSFRAWRLLEITETSPDEALVTVSVERLFREGFYDWKVREHWVRGDGSWKLRLDDPVRIWKSAWSSQAPSGNRIVSGQLDVLPARLKIHFFSGSRQGWLMIRNGWDEAVQVSLAELDRERFEVLQENEWLAAGTTGRLGIRYRGREIEKELTSELVLTLASASKRRTWRVPILYNHLSQAVRGLLRLPAEGVDSMRRGDSTTVQTWSKPAKKR